MMLESRHKPEVNPNEVKEVRFNFMTAEEVRRHSVVKITDPTLRDFNSPNPGGLYDQAMGPIVERSHCKTCDKYSFDCNGHYGHIELVSPAYNPLLFDLLHTLLQRTCFGCFRFRSGRKKVKKCVSLLELIAKGRVIEARSLEDSTSSGDDDDSPNHLRQQADSGGSNVSYDGFVYSGAEDKLNHNREPLRDSFQFAEAKSILKIFLGHKQKKCEYCGYKGNPKITKPTFGWFRLDGGSPESIRANIIMTSRLGRAQRESSSEVVTANDLLNNDLMRTVETESVTSASPGVRDGGRDDPVFKSIDATLDIEQKSVFSADILPSEEVKRSCGEVVEKQKQNYKTGFCLILVNIASFDYALATAYCAVRFSDNLVIPESARDVMKLLWENEAPLCSFIAEIQREQLNMSSTVANHLMFFLDAVIVSAIKFRPPAKAGDAVMEHPHTVLLSKLLQFNTALANAHVNSATRPQIIRRWIDLQQSINVLYDSKTATGQSQKDGISGICQLLEKKEGIFRQNMMGKRVNFACRSVISPDPYLAVNEIGIPTYFAQRLTYPERVNTWNVAKLRDAVVNGPEVHPGALAYVDTVSTRKLPSGDPSSRRKRETMARMLSSSRGATTHSRKNSEHDREGKVVLRHIRDGDIVLVNRQPTLHKPSIMAHVVRILKGEKTLRMHYANCSSYNADFDGDEMNVHFPQDEISRAEGYHIVNANEQYIVPTKGDTVRGLIQDHIVSAVLLTMKDTFLTLDEFNQLRYGSGVFTPGTASSSGKSSGKNCVIESSGEHVTNISVREVIGSKVPYIPPTVWKPKQLWTGKQVITSLLNHITRGCPPCTVEKETKIPKQYFPSDVYRDLLSKSEDKIAENVFLVWKNEFVCGVIDKAQFGQFGLVHTVQELYGSNTAGLLLSALSRVCTMFLQVHGFTCETGDLRILPHFDLQRKEELEGEDVGEEVHSEFTKFRHGQIGLKELHLEVEKVISANRESGTAYLDMKMKNRLTKKAENISKGLLREGLLKPFPKNCISLMTISGAKGSTVNFQQISSYLGQQELEGKRVPRMVSGKTLPCFTPWDSAARAGGYITDRFLTGLRQQEYYFHCMAGREGLVDTAVKTSRSGYLQRCLIKNLESLKVSYDYTVRDADCSIVQFHYGEDGVDPHSTSFLKNFRALTLNQEALSKKFHVWREFNTYIDQLPDGLKDKAKCFFKESNIDNKPYLLKLLKQKYLSSLAPSGEPVGVIAAQSVGEPSTQMTLNTFHLAGRGEMNVTLGIPRLQEILMTASNVIKTPVLACPFLDFKSKDDANSIVSKVKKITVADIVESIEVHLLPFDKKKMGRIYTLLIKFKCPEFVSLEDCKETLSHSFRTALEDAVENHVAMLAEISGIKARSKSSSERDDVDDNNSGATADGEGKESNDGDEGRVSDDEVSEGLSSNEKSRGGDDMDYEDGSEDEQGEQSSLDGNSIGKDTTTNEEDEESRNGEDEGNSIKESRDDDDGGDEGNVSEARSKDEEVVEEKSLYGEAKSGKSSKRKKRIVKLAFEGQIFMCHFTFTDEPDMLLAQIAQRTAKKVYIKGSGKISDCKIVDYDANEKTVIWDDSKKSIKGNNDLSYWGMKAAGVDFIPLWEMSEHLDVGRIYSNNIHAMLKTYGVEAARETIIREVKNVFGIYGVEVDYRHLSLIADYMTHDGGYRPMSRHGCIAQSMSPFLKMSFETPTKFIVEAALHGMSDHMETPSARVCLGLPVKIGTGSFDVMQKIEI